MLSFEKDLHLFGILFYKVFFCLRRKQPLQNHIKILQIKLWSNEVDNGRQCQRKMKTDVELRKEKKIE